MTVFIVSHLKFNDHLHDGEVKMYGGEFSKIDEVNLDGISHDHYNDNISQKNKYYSELTSLFAINQHCEIHKLDHVGLVHYRRRFSRFSSSRLTKNWFFKKLYTRLLYKSGLYLTKETIVSVLSQYDAILPQKSSFKMTMREQFARYHDINDLIEVRNVISILFPDYILSFDEYLDSSESYLFNMMVVKNNIIQDYCNWIFPILFELEKRIDIESKSGYQQRCMGYIAERLLNVFFLKNTHFKVKEYLVVPESTTSVGKVYVG